MSPDRVARWELAKLELFAHVAELGSLTRAAVARGSTQPAISRQIRLLERQCGGRLFHRTGRGVAPTDLGQQVLQRVRSILGDVELLDQEVSAAAGVLAGDVRIGVLPWMYRFLVYPLFSLVRERLPAVRLHVFEGSGGQIDEWLSSGRVTIGLPYRYGKALSNRNEQRLLTLDFHLVGRLRDSLASAKTVEFSKLAGIPLVLPEAPNHVRVALDEIARVCRIQLNVVLRTDSFQVQKEVVLRGQAFTVLPGHAVMEEIASGALHAARIVKPAVGRSIVLATTTARPVSFAAREVARLVREIVCGNPRHRTP